VSAGVGFEARDLDLVVGGDGSQRFKPELPFAFERVGAINVEDASPCEAPTPPTGGVEGPELVLLSPIAKVVWNFLSELTCKSRHGNAKLAAGLNESAQIVEEQVIGSKIHIRVDCDDCVEEFVTKREGPGVGADREDGIFDARVTNTLKVF